jgi:hypothetical protein
MPKVFPVNPNYRTVVRGLLRMHKLAAQGKFESPEADALRDAMDAPWVGLSGAERQRLRGLSMDLNELSEVAAACGAQQINSQAQGKLVEADEALQRGEWDESLDLLRQWGRDVPAAQISYLRGTIWKLAGDFETAAVFFEHASRLEPENDNYRADFLDSLKRVGLPEVAIRADEMLQNDDERPSADVVHAVD